MRARRHDTITTTPSLPQPSTHTRYRDRIRRAPSAQGHHAQARTDWRDKADGYSTGEEHQHIGSCLIGAEHDSTPRENRRREGIEQREGRGWRARRKDEPRGRGITRLYPPLAHQRPHGFHWSRTRERKGWSPHVECWPSLPRGAHACLRASHQAGWATRPIRPGSSPSDQVFPSFFFESLIWASAVS